MRDHSTVCFSVDMIFLAQSLVKDTARHGPRSGPRRVRQVPVHGVGARRGRAERGLVPREHGPLQAKQFRSARGGQMGWVGGSARAPRSCPPENGPKSCARSCRRARGRNRAPAEASALPEVSFRRAPIRGSTARSRASFRARVPSHGTPAPSSEAAPARATLRRFAPVSGCAYSRRHPR